MHSVERFCPLAKGITYIMVLTMDIKIATILGPASGIQAQPVNSVDKPHV